MRYVCSAVVFLFSFSNVAILSGQNLSITNYQIFDKYNAGTTQRSMTYTADLLNPGPALSSVEATVSSNVPNIVVVQGRDTLLFGPVPANSSVTSSNTFTILADTGVYFDLADLHWTFHTIASADPIANAGPDQTVAIGTKVTLKGSSSTNPSGIGTLTYSWVFLIKPAGSNAVLTDPTSVTPTFVADVAGNYLIQLTVSNGQATSSAKVTVSTLNSAPVASAGQNQTVAVGSTVLLSGSGSYDVDGNPLTYSWMMTSRPAGSAAALANAKTVSPSFVADKPGTYSIQLIVNDGHLDSLPATVTISTVNSPPVANAGPNQTVGTGSLVQLNGSGSTDVDGDQLTFSWLLITRPSGSAAALNSLTAVNPTFVADQPGTYVAQLIVNDGKVDSAPSTVVISTNNMQAPVANAGPNQTVARNATVMLSGSGTDSSGLSVTFLWAMILKPSGSSATLSSNSIPNPSFTADKPGTYVCQLIVNNGYLNSSPSVVTITTNNTPPVANAGANQSVPVGATATLDGSGSSDADNDSLTYSWSFTSRPAGSTAVLAGSTTKWPQFVCDVAGTYVIQLIVNDGIVNSNAATVTVNAYTASSRTIVLPQNLSINFYQSMQLPLTLSTPAPAGGVYVSLSTSDNSKATISPAVVAIPAGASAPPSPPTLSGVNLGSTTVTASANGYSAASAQVAVKGTVSFSPGSISLAVGTRQSIVLMLPAPAPAGGITVSLSSSNPSVAALPSTATILEGSATASILLTAGVAGVTVIHASSLPLIADSSATVTVVVPPSIILPSFLAVGQTVLGDVLTAYLPVKLSVPAPAGGVTVTLSSSDTSVLTVSPQSVYIAPGATAPSDQPQIVGYLMYTATVTASAPGYSTSSVDVAVTDEARITIPFNLTVAVGQSLEIPVYLPGLAPAGGVTVYLHTTDPSRVTVTPSVFIPAGASTPAVQPQIKGVQSGMAMVDAAAQGYTSVARSVQVTPAPTPP